MKRVIDYFAAKNIKLFQLVLRKWKTLKELIHVSDVTYNATIALQNPCITLSDVYGLWEKMRIRLEAYAAKSTFKTKLSQNLIQFLQVRYPSVFDNAQMKCALLLDPRFRRVIKRDRNEYELAKSTLVKLYHRLKGLQPSQSTTQISNASSDFNVSVDEESELNKLMAQGQATHNNSDRHLDIGEAIDLFQPEFMPVDKSVLEFWETQKQTLLYDLAMAVYSIPPTQVQIERDFSERRYRLSQERLGQILLIYYNKDLFYVVKNEELSNILKSQ